MFLLFNFRQGCNLNYVVFIMQLLMNEKIIALKLNRTVTINCGKIGIQIIAYYFLTGKRGPQIIISVNPYLHSEITLKIHHHLRARGGRLQRRSASFPCGTSAIQARQDQAFPEKDRSRPSALAIGVGRRR